MGLDELGVVGGGRRLAVGDHATAPRSPARSPPWWRARATRSSRRGVRHRPGRPPGCAGRRRPHRRGAGLWCRPRLPAGPPPAARPPREDLRRGLRAATGAVRVAHPLPEPQPPDRRPHPRHRRGRGGRPQRGAQHRRLGSPSVPAADVGARPGDGSPVRGRPRAAPHGCRQPRDPRRGGPRAGRRRAASTSSRPRAAGSTPATACRRASSRCSTRFPRHRGVGADSIARTAGIGLLDTQAALQRLERAGIVARTSDGWRIRDVNAPDSPAENAEVPTMNP